MASAHTVIDGNQKIDYEIQGFFYTDRYSFFIGKETHLSDNSSREYLSVVDSKTSTPYFLYSPTGSFKADGLSLVCVLAVGYVAYKQCRKAVASKKANQAVQKPES